MQNKNHLFPLHWRTAAFLFCAACFAACDMLPDQKPLDLGSKLPFGMIELYGDTTVLLDPYSSINTIIDPNGAALPLYDHALVYLMSKDEATYYVYQKEDGKKVQLDVQPGVLRVNGQWSTVTLDSSARTEQWLRNFRRDSMAQLRIVLLANGLPTAWYPRIFDIAKINPSVSFLSESFGEMEEKDAILLSGLRKATVPKVFAGNAEEIPEVDLRAVKTLYINKKDSLLPDAFFTALQTLPPGACLALDGFEATDIRRILQTAKPSALTLQNETLDDPQALAAWGGLQALFLTEPLRDARPLAGLERLEHLGFTAAEEVQGLELLRSLRYLSVEADSATAFALAARNPQLQFLHIKTDTLNVLPDWGTFKKLKGVALPPLAVEDYGALKNWNIRYIGVPASDSLIQVMRTAYPDGMIYAQGKDFWGACLGSGWFLLLFPLIWFFGFLKKRGDV